MTDLKVDTFSLDYSDQIGRMTFYRPRDDEKARATVSLAFPTGSILKLSDGQLRTEAVQDAKKLLQDALVALEAHPW